MSTYKIMTCNFLTDSLYFWGKTAFVRRAGAILSLFDEEQPDIAGVQEYTERMKRRLSPLNEKYGFTGLPRSGPSSEANPVFWRKDRFNLKKAETLWLSPRPDIPYTRHFGSQFPRIVTYAVLEDKSSGEIISLFNTHLDLYFPAVRLKQVQTLLSLIRERGLGKIIITGDFNETANGDGLRLISESMTDVVPDSLGSTLRGKNGSRIVGYLPVDHIFISPEITCVKTKKIRRKFDGIAPSDHYPVIAEISV